MGGDEARRGIRRVMRAKRATNPRVRGRYRRALRTARREAEARPAAAPAPPRRRIARWVLAVALLPVLLIAAVGAYAINLAVHTERTISKVQQPALPRATSVAVAATETPAPTSTPNILGTIAPLPTRTAIPATIDPIAAIHFDRKDPLTIMLLGVDTREGDIDSRSDTIILVYIDPTNTEDTVHLLSIPRDLLVTMAGGFGQGKMADVYATGQINHYLESAAHPNIGGPALVRDTLEQNFRLRIDFYAQVDFNGFRKIVDAVGGVTVDNPYPFNDTEYPTEDYQYTRVFFPAGAMHLYGEEALTYARSRYADDDYARNARQQQVLLGIRQQALQLNLLPKVTGLIDTLGDSVRTDFPIKDQGLAFAKFGVGVTGGAIRQFTLTDLLGVCGNCDGFYSVVNWQEARARAKAFSPRENMDALAAQATAAPLPPTVSPSGAANTGARVVIENGATGAIASQWAAALRQQGYANVSLIAAPPGTSGPAPTTQILFFASGSAPTAQALARTMGIDAVAVHGDAPHPPEAADADIVILIGDDARGP